jgi:hypothetical protein
MSLHLLLGKPHVHVDVEQAVRQLHVMTTVGGVSLHLLRW